MLPVPAAGEEASERASRAFFFRLFSFLVEFVRFVRVLIAYSN